MIKLFRKPTHVGLLKKFIFGFYESEPKQYEIDKCLYDITYFEIGLSNEYSYTNIDKGMVDQNEIRKLEPIEFEEYEKFKLQYHRLRNATFDFFVDNA